MSPKKACNSSQRITNPETNLEAPNSTRNEVGYGIDFFINITQMNVYTRHRTLSVI